VPKLLEGVYPIANTPFHDDGAVDFASQEKLIDHLLAEGAHGLGLFGNASEGYTLSSEERIALMKLIAKRVDGRSTNLRILTLRLITVDICCCRIPQDDLSRP